MRLQASREFAEIRTRGRRLVKGCLIANWMVLERPGKPRLGVITSRKIGGAVVRARARRQLREVFRVHQHELNAPVAIVLVARPSIAQKDHGRIEKDYLGFLAEAGLIKKQ
jgi:ribonuclease P protein component